MYPSPAKTGLCTWRAAMRDAGESERVPADVASMLDDLCAILDKLAGDICMRNHLKTLACTILNSQADQGMPVYYVTQKETVERVNSYDPAYCIIFDALSNNR